MHKLTVFVPCANEAAETANTEILLVYSCVLSFVLRVCKLLPMTVHCSTYA